MRLHSFTTRIQFSPFVLRPETLDVKPSHRTLTCVSPSGQSLVLFLSNLSFQFFYRGTSIRQTECSARIVQNLSRTTPSPVSPKPDRINKPKRKKKEKKEK